MRRVFLVLALLCIPLMADFVLDGKNMPEIVVGEKLMPIVTFAADELAYHLEKSFGSKIARTAVPTDGKRHIFLGVKPDGTAEMSESFDSHIVVRDNDLFIYGRDSGEGDISKYGSIIYSIQYHCTLDAVYTFLEDNLGVRWIEPGEGGECIPKYSMLTLKNEERTLHPTFSERRTYYLSVLSNYKYYGKQADSDTYCPPEEFLRWGIRLRLTCNGNVPVNGCHTPAAMKFEQTVYPQRPELFALQADGTRAWQDMCWSCQETKDFWWELADAYFQGKRFPYSNTVYFPGWGKDEFMIDPHDYGKDYFCTCPTCKGFLDKYGEDGYGECIFQTIAEVAKRVEAKYPGKSITTLVYPPKKMYPSSVELPKNVRVRMTVDALALCSDYSLKGDKELALMRKWSTQQESKIRLWMYVLFDFGMRLHGVPEFASTNFIEFLRKARPYTEGIFYEHIEMNHTMRNMDMYLMAHALWNLDLDLEATRNEFFKLAYGDAADIMKQFYERIEKNTDDIQKMQIAHPEELPQSVAQKIRKRVFNNVYTYNELEALQKLLDEARKKVPGGSAEDKRIMRYKTFVMDPARKEFVVYSDDKEHAFKEHFKLCVTDIKGEPTESDWDNAPWIDMVSSKEGTPMTVKSQFKVLASESTFYVRAKYDDPLIAKSRTVPGGNKVATMWDDNETEIFFASERTGEVIQIGINDNGEAVVHDQAAHKFSMADDRVRVKVSKSADGWSLTAAIDNSLTGFLSGTTEDAFNIIRARNVGDLQSEYHTYNPECIMGHWHIPAYYSYIRHITPAPFNMEYKGDYLKPNGGETELLEADAVANVKPWMNWVTPPEKAGFSRSGEYKFGAGESYSIDYSNIDPSKSKPSTSWRFNFKCPPKGTRIRVTATVLARGQRPDVGASLGVHWLNEQQRWYKLEEMGGVIEAPIKNGEWQQVAMDIVVPDIDEIKYFSPGINGLNVAGGKFYIGAVKIEIVK